MNKKAIVNALTILVTLTIVFIAVANVTSNFSITGYAIKDKVSKTLENKVNSNGDADVIIFLKDNNAKESLESKKIRIRQGQDDVLSTLNTKELRLKNKYSTINAISGNLSKEGLAKLKNNPNVVKIVENRKIKAFLTNSVPYIEAPQVWGININGRNITGQGQSICIIDTGVDYTHTSLGNCTLTNVTEHTCKVIAGYDFANNDTNPMDDQGHGTHVSGIAAANGSVLGVARGANIVAVKVLDSGGGGEDATAILGIDWCINNSATYNITVLSMSWGDNNETENYDAASCPTTYDSSFQAALGLGIIPVVASGNDYDTGRISAPACSPYAVAVGATNNNNQMASFSNINEMVDVLAPGVGIVSTCLGGGTCSKDGTSMATPHISGVAALLYQYEKEYNNKNATALEIKNLLTKSNVSVNRSIYSIPRVDALWAVNYVMKMNSSDNSVENYIGKIKFGSSTNLDNATEAFLIGNGYIVLNSSQYSLYNKSANITLYNLSYVSSPVIFRDGNVCNDCNTYSYSGGILTFDVPHFTNYSTSANSRLEIWDQADSEGGSVLAHVLDDTYFYANYTNITSGDGINVGACSINFTDSSSLMTYNSTSKLFEYNRTFASSNNYEYNISCNDTNYEPLNTTDSIFVSPACLDQTPNVNITIDAGTSTNCSNEEIHLINQSIFIYGNLTLNNTQITLESSGTASNGIFSLNSSNLIAKNLTLIGSVNSFIIRADNNSRTNIISSFLPGSFDFENYQNSSLTINSSNITAGFLFKDNSSSLIENSNLLQDSTLFKIQGNSAVDIINSSFMIETRFLENSISHALDAYFNFTRFLDSSFAELGGSHIQNISRIGTTAVILNFTLPVSIIDNIGEFFFNSKIYGYVDMPSSVSTYTAPNVARYYPVIVNYTNGSMAIGKQVNVTNSTGDVVYSTTTDSNGLAWINVNFTTGHQYDNYTVSVNPSENITLLTDTPLLFTLDSCVPSMTNTSWSDWSNISCIGDDMNQSQFMIEYDVNDCGTIPNTTYYNYTLVGPDYANTSFTSWYDSSTCYTNDTKDQVQNATQYNTYGCGSNTTIYNYSSAICDFCTPILANTSWSSWTNLSCVVDQMNQSQYTIEYDSLNCYAQTNLSSDNVTNTTYYNYTLVGPDLQNTSWTPWYNISSCVYGDYYNQSSNITEYDAYNCKSNTTYFDYRNQTCDFCTPTPTNGTWTDWYNISSCVYGDYYNQSRNITEYDSSNCGETSNQTFFEFRNQTCDFCVPSMTNTSWSDWINLTCVGDQRNQSQYKIEYDVNDCGETLNTTYYNYTLVGPELTNTSWTSWYDITACMPEDYINQSRNITQYDNYSCATNQTFFEYQNISCIFSTSAPIISNVINYSITNQSVKINWTTDELSNSTLNYGLTPSLGTILTNDSDVIIHKFNLSTLTNYTIYFYNVTSCNIYDNCTTEGPFNFTTLQNTHSSPGGSSGGDSGSGYSCPISFKCGDWSACINSKQTRTCNDVNNCVDSKTETKSCIEIKNSTKSEDHTSGIIETPKQTTPPKAEIPKASGFMMRWDIPYDLILWILLALFLIIIIVRRVETFPILIKRDERYIEKENTEKAERLYEKIITKFSKSRRLEREYTDKIEKLSEEMEEFEEKISKKQKTQQKPFIKKEMTYEDTLKAYQKAYDQYLSSNTEKREEIRPILDDLKKNLLKKAYLNNNEEVIR